MKRIFLTCCLMLSFVNAQASVMEEIFGNAENGDSCSSDYQCQSLCCDSKTNSCKEHIPNESVQCNKNAGETCVTSDFCASFYVSVCRLYKITNANGNPSCYLKCDSELAKGSCVQNRCVSPMTPIRPPFDPATPDCSQAI